MNKMNTMNTMKQIHSQYTGTSTMPETRVSFNMNLKKFKPKISKNRFKNSKRKVRTLQKRLEVIRKKKGKELSSVYNSPNRLDISFK